MAESSDESVELLPPDGLGVAAAAPPHGSRAAARGRAAPPERGDDVVGGARPARALALVPIGGGGPVDVPGINPVAAARGAAPVAVLGLRSSDVLAICKRTCPPFGTTQMYRVMEDALAIANSSPHPECAVTNRIDDIFFL